MNRSSHYVVFGAAGQHNKAVLVGPSKLLKGYECIIVNLADGEKYKAGDEIELSDIDLIYTTLYFTRLDSLKAFIGALSEAAERWEAEDESGGTDKHKA